MNDQLESNAWLHNMSVPPRNVVKFDGLGALARRRTAGGSGVTTLGYAGVGTFGRPVRFALAPDVLRRRLRTAGILRELEPTAKLRTAAARLQRIEALIESRAASLPLPEGCVVIPSHETHPALWSDLLTTLAVLAKCNDAVWLRARPPSLVSALERRSVSLLVPPAFVHALPAERPDERAGDPEVPDEQ